MANFSRSTLRSLGSVLSAVAVACGLAAGALWAADSETPGDFNSVKRKFTQQLTSRKNSDRLEALRGLKDYPCTEMVKLVAQRGLKDRDEELRQAALETLLAVKDNPEVCECLLDMLSKDTHRKGNLEGVTPVLRVLLASNLPDASDGLITQVDKLSSNKGTAENGVLMLASLADELGKKADPAEFEQLTRLMKFKAFKTEFGLRRAVVHAATRYTTKEAVAFLFTILAEEHGELRGDLVEYFTQVTGQKELGADVPGWLKWWQENSKTFEYPKRPAPPLLRTVAVQGMNSYYGIPIYAQRMVFVLDTSLSMRGPRIYAAKRDLTEAVMKLDDKAWFNMIAFDSRTDNWQSKLVQATPQMKRAAALWVDNHPLGGGTASYDALEAALTYDAEAIYFLTDGAPFGGKIVNPAEIVVEIGRQNRVRRESIYAIGIGVGPPGNLFDTFLKTLSDENYGLYRRVDE